MNKKLLTIITIGILFIALSGCLENDPLLKTPDKTQMQSTLVQTATNLNLEDTETETNVTGTANFTGTEAISGYIYLDNEDAYNKNFLYVIEITDISNFTDSEFDYSLDGSTKATLIPDLCDMAKGQGYTETLETVESYQACEYDSGVYFVSAEEDAYGEANYSQQRIIETIAGNYHIFIGCDMLYIDETQPSQSCPDLTNTLASTIKTLKTKMQ